MSKVFLKVLAGEKTEKIPFWLMRQAGRYLPEYRQLREKAGSFLNLCYNPEHASEVTLQPIRRFGMDAAIIFSDILVVPHAMGLHLDYLEGRGPMLTKIRNKSDIKNLIRGNHGNHLKPIYETIKIVKSQLPQNTALIGFAGAPWTVATYMVEGGASKHFEAVRKMAMLAPEMFQELIDIIVDETLEYLVFQIKYGAEAIQIFDSWAGILSEKEFDKWVIEPTKKLIDKIRETYPDVPIIGFPKGAGVLYKKYTEKTGVTAVGIDSSLPLKWAKTNLQKKLPVQGNLDPMLLAINQKEARKETKRILKNFSAGSHIFNLGHGVLPYTPIENVEAVIEEIRNFSR